MPETNLKQSKIPLGISLLILGTILVFGKPLPKENPDLDYSFSQEPVKVEDFESHEKGDAPTKIIVPGLSIDLEVGEARVINGYWEVFPDKAGWGEGAGLPGENGNQVIFAHAREELFLPLKDVEVGMKVYVTTENAWYSYRVEKIKEVFPNQIEVIKPTEDETLTLYTCSGFNDEKRLIVIAKPGE
jgi:LPXTG-site transpeptidase (sortase) family protein